MLYYLILNNKAMTKYLIVYGDDFCNDKDKMIKAFKDNEKDFDAKETIILHRGYEYPDLLFVAVGKELGYKDKSFTNGDYDVRAEEMIDFMYKNVKKSDCKLIGFIEDEKSITVRVTSILKRIKHIKINFK